MVKYLAWYINNKRLCSKGSYWINVENEIQKYKEKYPERTPTVILDFISSITIFIKDAREILSAGRQVVCTNKAELLCRKFKGLEVDLVFFLNGPIQKFKYSTRPQRANDKYTRECEIFESIKNGNPVNMRYDRQILSTYFEIFLIIARKYGEIVVSLHRECAIDLAAYATKINATAVIAMDTDFLIMPGDWPIWSPTDFDIGNFKTTAWNKKSLRLALDLRQTQMPIFSILCGNKWIPYENVKYITEMMQGGKYQAGIAEFIRRNFPRGVDLSKPEFDKLVDLIFKNGENGFTLKEATDVVNMSLEFYNYDHHIIPEVKPEWLKKHIEDTGSSLIYKLVNDLPLVIHQSLIDLSKVDVQPYAELALPIFRRILGLANYDKRIENIKKIIWLKSSHEEPYQEKLFSPLFPEKPVPSLPKLLEYEEEEIPTLTKFEIFCWLISPRNGKLDPADVMKLSGTLYFRPVLALNYLVQEFQITLEEADVVLLTIYEANQCSAEKLENMKPPEVFNERPFWIAFVFNHLERLFADAMLVCGLFKYIQRGCLTVLFFIKCTKCFCHWNVRRKENLLNPLMNTVCMLSNAEAKAI